MITEGLIASYAEKPMYDRRVVQAVTSVYVTPRAFLFGPAGVTNALVTARMGLADARRPRLRPH